MSLHKFAEQVASQGRGDDSLLVHMTPDEVRNLQQFAQANGTTLTINPTTGLPEAGLLSDLFKAVAPIALGAFLGPAGLGMSSMMAGVATGGITTLATGSLSRGLMAGLGAYGGAGLGESLMGAGGNALVAGGAPVGAENLVGGVSSSGATAGSAVSAPPIEQINPSNFNLAKPDVLSAGAKAAAANPMAFAKQNLGNLAYAAAPIAAGMMVPTTTKLPDPKDTGRIRQMAFNINPDTGRPDPLYGMREMPVVKASDFGDKTFKGQRDLFYQQNPNPYELGVGSLNQPPQQQPPRMNTGGIVALAKGGDVKHYVIGGTVAADLEKAYAAGDYAKVNDLVQANRVSEADIQNQWKGLDTSGLAGLGINLVTPYVNYTDEQMGSYFAANPNTNIAEDIVKFNADPAAVNRYIANIPAPFVGSTETTGGSGTLGVYNNLIAQGIDPNELYASRIANDPNYAGWTKDMLNTGYNLAGGALDLVAKDKDGVTDKEWVNFMDTNGYSINDMAQSFGLSLKEVRDRYNAVKNAEKKVVTPITTVTGTGTGGTGINTVTPDPFTSVIPGGFYGNATNPGDIMTNKDGTVTVQPNIPYRPYGGFSGIEEVSNAYTKGGGSLGYKAAVPKTAAEHNALYNKQTDDSLDAYNFLMGKGKNLTQRTATADRPVMRRYDEAVLGRKIPRLGSKTTNKTTTVTGVPGNPQSYFDEKAYLAANPDVAEELRTGKSVTGEPTQFKSGYEHYLMYGKAGGRAFTGDYEGYTTAAALANAAQQGGGDDGGAAAAAAAAASAADSAAASAASASGTAPGSDGSPGSGAKNGGMMGYAMGGGLGSLGSYSDGGRLLRGPGDGVSDSIPATIGRKRQPARLADGEFVIPARIVSELGNGSTDAGAKKLYAMMDRVQRARGKTTGKNKVAANSRADKYLPA